MNDQTNQIICSWLFSQVATLFQELFYFNSVDQNSEHFTKIINHSRAVVRRMPEMLQFHHKHVMRSPVNTLKDAVESGMWHHKPETLCSPQSRCPGLPVVHVMLFIKDCWLNCICWWKVLTETAQALLLTFVESALHLQMCPYRHEFLKILLRDFYREEIPLVDIGYFWRKPNLLFEVSTTYGHF